MYLFISGVNRSEDYIETVSQSTLGINDELQEKTNSAHFELKGTKPSSNSSVRMFAGYPISASTASSITLDATYDRNNEGLFRVGDDMFVALNLSDEERCVISTITNDGGYIKLTMTGNFTNQPVAGELAGKLSFAGNVVDVQDSNIRTLNNIQYSVSCIDKTRIFDKSNANDSFTSRDARYIVNAMCNRTVNLNDELDGMDYANNTAIQAEWVESGDGTNPTVDTNFREGDSSGKFSWTFSGGTATFTASPLSRDSSSFTGAASGSPTKGVIGFWYKTTDYTAVTSFQVRVGSDSSNYARVTVVPSSNDWVYSSVHLDTATVVGTPVWTALDYLAVVVTETATSSILFDGFRLLEEDHFRHYPYVEESDIFPSFNMARIRPTEVMQRLADTLAWYWYIDYEGYIHLFPSTTNLAPFNINETSNNFIDLNIAYDDSAIVNRVLVKGGDQVSSSYYYQVKEGDAVTRFWLSKTKFKSLQVFTDTNTATDTCESGTNTTTIVATAHGLSTGDFIVNRTRSNAVRQVVVVSANSFTVDAVTSQTNGDTFSKFVERNVGVEGYDSDSANDYMSNYNEKSIRASEDTATLTTGQFIQFKYLEVNQILVQRQSDASIANMKSVLGHSDGIFDGRPIEDKKIKTRSEAAQVATAYLTKYANTVITASFKTYQHGLKSGQLITIKDTDNGTRNINQTFVIQRVQLQEIQHGYHLYEVTCSTLLFGMLELITQLLRKGRLEELEVADEIVNIYGFSETTSVSDAVSTLSTALPFTWGTSGASDFYWGLFEWS